MNSQQFDKRVDILQHTQEKDDWGTPIPGSDQWAPITAQPLWANIKHLSGAETVRAGGDVSVVRASIRIRWRTNVDASMLVRHGADRYKIEAVLPADHRQHVDLVCELVKGR